MTHPRCALLCVGSELLRGKINTHASTIARRLAAIGLTLDEEQTLADSQEALARAIRQFLLRFEIVLVTGGLGPTFDDVTREAAAEATDRRLEPSKTLLKIIQTKFRKAQYRNMPPANARQAEVLAGARVIANGVGTAPGQWLDLRERVLVLLPGPPSELIPMLDAFLIPQLKKRFRPAPRAEAHLHFVGVPESVIDHQVRPIIARAPGLVDFTILAHLGLVDLDIFVSTATPTKARQVLQRLVRQVRRRVGNSFYGLNDAYPLEKVVGDQFKKQRQTLAVAESCTGGLLASRLTDIAGSSDFFLGGVVSYSNRVKVQSLGVPGPLLVRHGAVSEPVARAMAEGARSRLGADWGVGITGIAGPTGGTRAKPVGLVFIASAGPRGSKAYRFEFRGSRDAIRQRAVLAALDVLRRC